MSDSVVNKCKEDSDNSQKLKKKPEKYPSTDYTIQILKYCGLLIGILSVNPIIFNIKNG